MRQALVSGNRAAPTIEVVTIAAPSGGLNTRDSALAMPPTDARTLVNVIARPGSVDVRDGALLWATGLNGWVETLMSFVSPSGQSKLFAATSNAVYDVTTSGLVGSPVLTGLSNGRWQFVNFANSANLWLVAVNGQDSMRVFDGTSWSTTPSLGLVTTNNLVSVAVYQKRLFFLEKNSRRIHYLSAGAISGTAETLKFEQLMARGGKIQAIGTWTVDAGDGLDDLFVAITSEGEAIVYSGIDPSTEQDWRLKGVYYVGKPVGDRCLFKVASELVVLTDRGLYPMSRALSESAVKREGFITDKINNEFFQLATENRGLFGWQAEVSTSHNLAIVNIPTARRSRQLVMDLSTYGWSYFLGWDARCFHQLNNDLFYGGDGVVVKCMHGSTDFGGSIHAIVSPAFLSFGAVGRQKHVKLLRPLFTSTAAFKYRIGVTVDLELDQQLSTVFKSDYWPTPYWDEGVWGAARWGGLALSEDWHTVFSYPGAFLAVYLRIEKNSGDVRLLAVDYSVQRGGLI